MAEKMIFLRIIEISNYKLYLIIHTTIYQNTTVVQISHLPNISPIET